MRAISRDPIGTGSPVRASGPDIAAASPRYNARLVRRLDLTDSLAIFWVEPDGEPVDFLAGQYFALGVEVGGKLVQRPYSAASSPRERGPYEFYVRRVDGGLFTPLLWSLQPGHRLSLKGPKGHFVLPDDGDDRTLVFVSTGTGVAPFVSMLRTMRADGVRRRAVVLHGASYVEDLGYRGELERYQREDPELVCYVPTISRPGAPENAGWVGRCGRAEAVVPVTCTDLCLRPGEAVAYLCGNPAMVERVEADLLGLGFPPADVKKELYWPAGRPPRGTA